MAFGYERHCPKCERQMSYEKCAGFVLFACSCGYTYVLEGGWVDE